MRKLCVLILCVNEANFSAPYNARDDIFALVDICGGLMPPKQPAPTRCNRPPCQNGGLSAHPSKWGKSHIIYRPHPGRWKRCLEFFDDLFGVAVQVWSLDLLISEFPGLTPRMINLLKNFSVFTMVWVFYQYHHHHLKNTGLGLSILCKVLLHDQLRM